jgi:hypothetical protein
MKKLSHSDFARDFANWVRLVLLSKKIIIVGVQGYDVTYSNGSTGTETAYVLHDNGVSRIRTYDEVLAIASDRDGT